MTDPILTCTHADGVATVTLNRPAARNALSGELRVLLRSRIAELDADDGVGAIILTGAGTAFCAGMDIRELTADAAPAQGLGPLTAPFLAPTTPLIGAVNGAAYTGGLELALNCHLLVASERATFADTHSRLGLLPGWGLTVLLTDAVGVRRARQLSLTCEPIDATTALEWGLVSQVVAHDELLAACTRLARAICANDRAAVRRVSALYDAQTTSRTRAAWQLEAAAFVGTRPTGSPSD